MTWLCLSKLYFVYMICISMLSCFSVLVRNVKNQSLYCLCLDPVIISNFVFVGVDD